MKPLSAASNLHLFQEASEDLKPALTGNKTMQYVPNSHDVKMALEIYKLTLEVELLQLQIQKEKHTEAH